MNTWVHVSFWTVVFSRYMPRSGIAGSYGSSIFCFKVHLDGKSNILFNFETCCSTTLQHKDAYPSSADLILILLCSRHWAMYLLYIISFFNELILNILFWNNFKFTEECQESYQELSYTLHPSSWVFNQFSMSATFERCLSYTHPPSLSAHTHALIFSEQFERTLQTSCPFTSSVCNSETKAATEFRKFNADVIL